MTPGIDAFCAIHADSRAVRTCERCGNFMCGVCAENGGSALCPKCRALTGDASYPFSREQYSFGAIWNYAFERWKVEFLMLSIGVLIIGGVSIAGSVVSNIFQSVIQAIGGKSSSTLIVALGVGTFVSSILNAVLQGMFKLGLNRMSLDVLFGRKADINRMMSQFKKFGRVAVLSLLQFAVLTMPLFLLWGIGGLVAIKGAGVDLGSLGSDPDDIVRNLKPAFGALAAAFAVTTFIYLPFAIYVGLPMILAPMELMYSDCEAFEALRRAFVLAKGHRLSIFGFGFMGGLVVMVGLFACCIGALPAAALADMLNVGLFMALRKGSELPPVQDV